MYESSKYYQLRVAHGRAIAQTLDSPVLVMDYWELTDVYATLIVVIVGGLIMAQWLLTLIMLVTVLGVVPSVRKNNEKGFLYHWPYKQLGIELRGITNPQRRSAYSD